MKKRILATLLVGAVAVSSAVGFSACDSVSVPKGEQVTKDVWETAFEKTAKLENLTLNTYESGDITVKGTVADYDSRTEKTTNKKVESTATMSSSFLFLYNLESNTAYDELDESYSLKVKTDGEEQTLKSKELSYSYYEPSEEIRHLQYYWNADYRYKESESNSEGSYEHSTSETDWTADETSFFPSSTVSSNLEDILGDEYYTDSEMKTSAKYLNELYDSFTYSNGKYTATLYLELDIYSYISEVVECKVTVSFKDGYIIGFSAKTNQKGTIEDKEDKMYYFDYNCKVDCVLSITDIGKTDVSKKLNKNINKALDKAKEEKAKENN